MEIASDTGWAKSWKKLEYRWLETPRDEKDPYRERTTKRELRVCISCA